MYTQKIYRGKRDYGAKENVCVCFLCIYVLYIYVYIHIIKILKIFLKEKSWHDTVRPGTSKYPIKFIFFLLLLLAIYCWACSLTLRVICFPSEIPLKKMGVRSVCLDICQPGDDQSWFDWYGWLMWPLHPSLLHVVLCWNLQAWSIYSFIFIWK